MLAIHHRSGSFSEKWIEYCRLNNIPYKLVDCYSTNILKELSDCYGLMWHWAHYDYKAVLFARQLTYSLEKKGLRVFPNSASCWHFDDKVGQKYLLEAIELPIVPTYVFYDVRTALEWVQTAAFPKVFKLRGGAGAENVRLIRSRSIAKRFIKRSFSKGFKVKNRLNFLKERLWQLKRDRSLKSFLNIAKGLGRLVIANESEKRFPLERSYAYFQDFIPNNDHDIRVVVIGRRAFAIKRMVRDGDFRASGSGYIVYDKEQIPIEAVKLAFEASDKISTQCMAYDFVFMEGSPFIVEISYAFSSHGYTKCPGHWTRELDWVPGNFRPEDFMIQDIINEN